MATTLINAQVLDNTTIDKPTSDSAAPSWQQELQNSFTNTEQLLSYLKIDQSRLDSEHDAFKHFPIKVPRPFAARMQPGDINDPLFLQVLPQLKELTPQKGFTTDPLGELNASPIEGLLHKYHGRVLLVTTSSCAIHCRYCFRQHFPYNEHRASKKHWLSVFDYIRNDPTITEVILSGGDPLNCPDTHLEWISQQLETIPHLTRLRIHTRLPIVIPERINAEFLRWVDNCKLKVVLVLHSNHANELDEAVSKAVSKLTEIKILLLNQSVLLKDVNDNANSLSELSERLFEIGVQPYYLHLLDKVAGSAHFNVEIAQVEALYQQLLFRLPGYLVPKLVKEIDGTPSKVPVTIPFGLKFDPVTS